VYNLEERGVKKKRKGVICKIADKKYFLKLDFLNEKRSR
jgi:hypothetical protein